MNGSHFSTLAQIDEHRLITACRHGVVHLIWDQVTLRLAAATFERLVYLLHRATQSAWPPFFEDEELSVSAHDDGTFGVRIDQIVLVLSASELKALARAAQQAARRLEELLASSAWSEDEAEDDDPLEVFRQVRFSQN
jgi:hypothetical protein